MTATAPRVVKVAPGLRLRFFTGCEGGGHILGWAGERRARGNLAMY